MNLEEARAIAALHESMDAEIQVSIRDLPGLSPGQLAMRRMKMARRIMANETTAEVMDHDWCDIEAGRPQFAIILPAPQVEDAKLQRSLASRGGKYLRAELESHRLYHGSDYHVIHAVPEVHTTAVSELTAREWRPALLEALELVDARYVLCVGAMPFSHWRRDVKLGWSHGRLHLWQDRWFVYGIESPDAILHPSADKIPWKRSINAFVRMVMDGVTPIATAANSCVKCSATPVWAYDRDGVAWCKQHAKAGLDGRQKTKDGWFDPKINGQIGLVLNMERSA
jgi:hypothetical protein